MVSKFSIGQVVSNLDIITEFKCGNMGGMRRSKSTNSLVLISDLTKGLYDDKWVGYVLHYTGMGKIGDQSLYFMQNRTLAESRNNGITNHLFEVLQPKEYTYLGVVSLIGKPYQAKQKDENGQLRNVWMFPLKLDAQEPVVSETRVKEYIQVREDDAKKMSINELQKRAIENESVEVSVRNVSSNLYIRDPYISEYARRRANGKCQLCGEDAPFRKRDGTPYLESHHIEWVSLGGSDTIENTVALCPNCHKKMHVLNLKEDIELLMKKTKIGIYNR